MSGRILRGKTLSSQEDDKQSTDSEVDAQIVSRVRKRADLPAGGPGPTDELIVQGVRGFAREFQYWYNRVLQGALPKYQNLIIDRINPMIRGMELSGLATREVAERLVADYARRNYVTAGGWALEQLAIAASPELRKSSAAGIDAELYEEGPPLVRNLYVIKSGTVTRNSDILKQLKTHGQEAQKRLLQTDKRAVVRVYYIVVAGRRSSTYEDGVHRPSSAEFWAQAFALDDEKKAIDLALAMAQEAGLLLRGLSAEAERSVKAMETAVAAYIQLDSDSGSVDWEFLAQRNMIDAPDVVAAGKERHLRAKKAVEAAGFVWPKRSSKRKESEADALAEAAAELTPEMATEIAALLPELSDRETQE
jgi:hypothetical protein